MSRSLNREALQDITNDSPVHPHRGRKKNGVQPVRLFGSDESVNRPFINPVREPNSEEPGKSKDIKITLKSTRINGYIYLRYVALNQLRR